MVMMAMVVVVMVMVVVASGAGSAVLLRGDHGRDHAGGDHDHPARRVGLPAPLAAFAHPLLCLDLRAQGTATFSPPSQ